MKDCIVALDKSDDVTTDKLIKLADKRGITVFLSILPREAKGIFCLSDETAIISISNKNNNDEIRYQLARMLGHAVLHAGLGINMLNEKKYESKLLRKIEDEADRFARKLLCKSVDRVIKAS